MSQPSKEELLLTKEQEWAKIGDLARLLGINPTQAYTNSRCYHDSRVYNLVPTIVGTSNHTFDDIMSILKTGAPLFESIHDIRSYEEEKTQRDAMIRLESEARAAAEKERMAKLRKKLAEYLAKDGSLLKVHEIDDNTVQIMLDGYESKKGRK